MGFIDVQSGEGARCPIGGGPAALNPTRRCTGNHFTIPTRRPGRSGKIRCQCGKHLLASNLARHMRRRHRVVSEKKRPADQEYCDMCADWFDRRQRERHYNVHHAPTGQCKQRKLQDDGTWVEDTYTSKAVNARAPGNSGRDTALLTSKADTTIADTTLSTETLPPESASPSRCDREFEPQVQVDYRRRARDALERALAQVRPLVTAIKDRAGPDTHLTQELPQYHWELERGVTNIR